MYIEEIPQRMYDTKTGRFWLPVDDFNDPVISFIKNDRMFDENVVDVCLQYIKEGTGVIDVGANFGQMTLQWSNHVGEHGKVYSFECSEFVSYFLTKTLELNRCTNVILNKSAVWHTADLDLNMLLPDGSYHGQFFSGMGIRGEDDKEHRKNIPYHKVKSTTLDSIDYEVPISLIKVDAQGSDVFVLEGGRKIIEKYKPFIVFEYEKEYDSIFDVSFNRLHEFLISLGYEQKDLIQNSHDFCYIHKDNI